MLENIRALLRGPWTGLGMERHATIEALAVAAHQIADHRGGSKPHRPRRWMPKGKGDVLHNLWCLMIGHHHIRR